MPVRRSKVICITGLMILVFTAISGFCEAQCQNNCLPAGGYSTVFSKAIQDTYISSVSPDESHGHENIVMFIEDAYSTWSLLAFDYSARPASFRSCLLALQFYDGYNCWMNVSRVTAAWTEDSTWNTRPALGSSLFQTFLNCSSICNFTYDVTPFVKTGTNFSISFTTNASYSGGFYARHPDYNDQPLLIWLTEPGPQGVDLWGVFMPVAAIAGLVVGFILGKRKSASKMASMKGT